MLEGGVAYLALAVSILALGTAAWRSLSRGRIYAFLFGALTLYGVFTLARLPTLADEFSRQSAYSASYVFLLGTTFLLGSIGLCEWLVPRAVQDGPGRWRAHYNIGADAHIRWSILASAASLALFLLAHPDLSLSWSGARAADSESGLLVAAATFLLLTSFPATATAILRGRNVSAVVLLAFNLACFTLSGSRAAALAALAALFWLAYMRTESSSGKFWILTSAVLLIFVVHVGLRFIRGLSPVDLVAAINSGNLLDLWGSSGVGEDLSGGESDVATYFVYAVGSAGSGGFGFMTTIARLGLVFFPKAWLPFEKPMDVTNQLWASAFSDGLFNSDQGLTLLKESFVTGNLGSIHATVFGELFVSGGWLSLLPSAVLIGAFCVFIDRCLVQLKAAPALLILGPTAVGMLMVARGNSVIGFGYFVYVGTFVVAVELVGRLLLPRKPIVSSPLGAER
jgi:hypothetical protein